MIPGNAPDATGLPGANGGRFGFFSDIYYDIRLNQWWAISDRGPGGGLLNYDTRLTRFAIYVNPVTGRISEFTVLETVKFTDPMGLLEGPGPALNGLNPFQLRPDRLSSMYCPTTSSIAKRLLISSTASMYHPVSGIDMMWGFVSSWRGLPEKRWEFSWKTNVIHE